MNIPTNLLTHTKNGWVTDASDLQANGIPFNKIYTINGEDYHFTYCDDENGETIAWVWASAMSGLTVFND
jgi:hypothetical protein